MSIANYMVDEIAVGAYAGRDANQVPSYSAPVVVRARIEEGDRIVRRSTGELVVVNTTIATLHHVSPQDRVWLAPFAGNDSPRVFASPLPTLVDSDARTPKTVVNARGMSGTGGHTELTL